MKESMRASPCSCRRSRQTYEEGCADDPEAGASQSATWLIMLLRRIRADVTSQREEALDILLKKAEENGLSTRSPISMVRTRFFAICNCNVNVCYALRTSQLFNTPNMSRSAYVAKVERQRTA